MAPRALGQSGCISEPQIGRFFSIKTAAIALGLLLGGLGFGAYLVHRVTAEGRISIGGFIVSGLLVLAGLGTFFMAFPRGCKACSSAFTEVKPTFPGNLFEQLKGALASQRIEVIQQLAQSPPAQGQVARINLDYCEGCQQIGVVTASLETYNAQSADYDVNQMGDEQVLSGPMVAGVVQVAHRRAAISGE